MRGTLDAIKADPGAFAARIGRPERAAAGDVDAALAGVTDAGAAWRLLADRGLVPRAWLDPAARAFCEPGAPRARSPRPPTVAACAALAAHVEGVEAAEARMREAVRRLRPWGCPPITRLVWCVGGSPRGSRHRTLTHASSSRFRPEVAGESWAAWEGEAAALARRFAAAPGIWALEAGWDVSAAHWWGVAARERWAVPPELLARQPRPVREGLAGRLLRQLPSPFEPLLELWWFGYGRGEITARDATLVVPEAPSASRHAPLRRSAPDEFVTRDGRARIDEAMLIVAASGGRYVESTMKPVES